MSAAGTAQAKPADPAAPQLDHVFSYWARMDRPQVIGAVPEGIRVFFPIAAGEATGPRIHGPVLHGGGDWMTVLADGVMLVDVRATLRTGDGAVIYCTYTGVGDLGPDGYRDYLERRVPASIRIRAASRFQTAHPKYLWLNRLQCLNIGEADVAKGQLRYDVYAVG